MFFDEIQMGDLNIKNRLVMAPLTRCRASEGRLANELMVEYYRQRASAGMILTEATAVTPMGLGYPDTPGIWNAAQTESWKAVTDAVHAEGGLIVMQLWHVGRISDPYYLNGRQPVAPSAVAAKGHVSLLRPKRPYSVPRALERDEIPQVIEAYRQGAENAENAGFDGVEIHGANGYLPDQFLQSSTNLRTDDYGGTIENRARFLLEATDAAVSVWGPGRVGVHLSPRCDSHDMGDDDAETLFTYVGAELGRRKIAFIFTREHDNAPVLSPKIKEAFGGPLIANQDLSRESAEKLLKDDRADAVSFGRLFISNPDLPERFRRNAPLNPWDSDTFYRGGAEGYTDYSPI